MVNGSLGETPMNNCTARWQLLEFNSPRFVLLSLVLAALTVFTIAGNCLVVAAIVLNRRLRSVTGILILSLAVADLLVGVFVLPFSVANQVLQDYWIFGNVWCQVWLAVDVWMCTSSIYNLVAISIDRYVAIVKPLNYPHLVTKRRARMAISIAWTLSFLICLPPMIIYWPSALAADSDSCICTPMNNSSLYIIYSACGSFFIPMVLIAIIYYHIYGAARRATHSLVSGMMLILPTSRTSIAIGQQNSTPSAAGQLRIHRGGMVKKDEGLRYKRIEPKNATLRDRPSSNRCTPDLKALVSGPRPARNSLPNIVEVEPTIDTKPTTDAELEDQLRHLNRVHHQIGHSVDNLQNESRNYCSADGRYVDDVNTKPTDAASAKQVTHLKKIKLNNQVGNSTAGPCSKRRNYSSIQHGHGSSSSCNTTRNYCSHKGSSTSSARSIHSRSHVPNRSSLGRRLTAQIVQVLGRTVENLNKKNRYQKRLSAEIKAAKTVAIVTGCFVCCWLGFAVSYALQAVNVNVSSTLFGVFFWLGQVLLFVLTHCNKSEVPLFRYSNSALNPVIYTVFNHEYRWTFKRLLICRSVKSYHRMARTCEPMRFPVTKSESLCRQSVID